MDLASHLTGMAAALALSFNSAVAGEQRRSGDFDYYVLSLSWSPSWCAANPDKQDTRQCDPREGYGFIVHGLWPQYESSYPEFCSTRQSDRVPERIGREYLDIIPSMGLIGHEWRKHGTCSGLDQAAYFETLRTAYERVHIPPALANLRQGKQADPDLVEKAFIAANPEMRSEGISATCSGKMLEEVRVCFTRDLQFRECREVDKNACRLDTVNIPPIP